MSYWLKRTLCDVLSEMRKCSETKNYSYLDGLIEECQYLGNSMEAALGYKKDFRYMKEDWSKLKAEIKELEKQKKDLESIVGKIEDKPRNKHLGSEF